LSEKFIVRAMKPDEMEAVGEGCLRAYGSHFDWRTWAARYPHRPGYTPAMHRVGVLSGRIIAHAVVESAVLRYGGARLRVAGIGKVYTDDAYRGKGYAAAVLRDALTYAIERRAHLALLNGIRGYYTRFGFYPVFPRYFAAFNAQEAAGLQSPLTLRPARPDEIPILAALFERHCGGRVTFLRPPDTWVWRVLRGDNGYQVWVVAEDDSPPQGYFAGGSLAGEYIEVVADTAQALEAGRDLVRWLLPPDDALIAFAQGALPITLSAEYEPDGGWMARLIDVQGVVDALLPELVAQGRVIMPEITSDALSIAPTARGVEIALRGQPQTRAVLSQRDFIQLLFGSLNAAALGLRDGLSSESIRLLQALFPQRVAALGGWDWF
jgi:predicted N-acetyltransferase YhbS